jgi:hypothetical protein
MSCDSVPFVLRTHSKLVDALGFPITGKLKAIHSVVRNLQ